MISAPSEPRQGEGTTRLFGLDAVNVVLLVAGVSCVAIGYVLLARGSTVAAPLLLVLGYVILVPAALLVGLGVGDTGPDSGE